MTCASKMYDDDDDSDSDSENSVNVDDGPAEDPPDSMSTAVSKGKSLDDMCLQNVRRR